MYSLHLIIIIALYQITTISQAVNDRSYDAIRHKMVPLKFAAIVFLSIELFDLRYVVFELHRQSDSYSIARSCPCTGI